MSPGNGPLQSGCDDNWTWDESSKSHEAYISEPHAVIFHPNWSCGTAGVRGTRVLNNGVHYWEILLSPMFFGSSIMFGIGKKSARLHSKSFINLIGQDECSWGLSHKGLIIHGGKMSHFIPPFQENKVTKVGLLFNGITGTLTYYKDGICLGVAFKGLNYIKEPLYPMVASTAAKTRMTLINTKKEFLSLQNICREVVAQTFTHNQLESLCLPVKIKLYIKDYVLDYPSKDFEVPHSKFLRLFKKSHLLP